MKTRRGSAGRVASRKSRPFSRPVLERVEDRLLLTIFTVNNTSDDNVNPNPGSLRQAIIDSNADSTSLPNQIVFDLPTGLQTITPVAPFDDITTSVIIDGTTASGYDAGAPAPVVQIRGDGDGNSGSAFTIAADNVTIKALMIDRFAGSGIVVNNNNALIVGNWIGLDASGTAKGSNSADGITINSANNTVGGTTAADRNVISGNLGNGILISSTGTGSNLITGNFIGTNPGGEFQAGRPLGNSASGISVLAANNTIGGSTSLAPNGQLSGAGNVISGNGTGVTLSTASATGNLVRGNFIGTDLTGLQAVGNGTRGIFVSSGATNNQIGVADPPNVIPPAPVDLSLRNVIAANGGSGVEVSAAASTNNRIRGNLIGVGIDGTTPLGNGLYGVFVNGSSNTIIGGLLDRNYTTDQEAPLGNTIANSGQVNVVNGDGVFVTGAQSVGIFSNRIFDNAGLGIRLNAANGGVVPPTLDSVKAGPSQVQIFGSLSGLPDTLYRIQFFASPIADPSGSGEGRRFLGDLQVTTDSAGNFPIKALLPSIVSVGEFVSATAIQEPFTVNNTSQFSNDVRATLAELADLSVVTTPSAVQPLLNQDYTYTLVVRNNGPKPATGVVFTDTIPASATFISSKIGSADFGTFSDGVLTGTIGNLGVGRSVTIRIVVRPNTITDDFTNVATVTADQLDINPNNDTSTTKLSVAANADLAATLDVSPNPAPVGSQLTYTLVVNNNGPSTVNDAIVTITLPDALANILAMPDQGQAVINGNVLTIDLGILPSGSSSTTVINATPNSTGTITLTAVAGTSPANSPIDPNPANNTATVDVDVQNAADLALTIDAAPSPVLVGQTLLYTIVVTNNGPSDATGATVSDPLPAGVTYIASQSDAGPGGTLSFADGVVTARIGLIRAGDSHTVIIAVIPRASGQLVNAATVNAADEIDPDPSNNTATATTLVSPADIGVTIIGPADPLVIGTPAVYQIVVFNGGPATATDVTLTDTSGANGTIIASSIGVVSGNKLVVNLGTLASGATITVTVTVNPTASGPLVNTASVDGDQIDPNLSNNTQNFSNLVSPVDLAVVVTASPGPILIGGQVVFVATVTNFGPTTATNVLFTNTLPGFSVLDSVATSQGIVLGTSGNLVTGNLGTLAPGASANVIFLVTINAVSTATDTFAASSDGFETDTTNNVGSDSVEVINLPGNIQIATPLVVVGEDAGFATIVLTRVNGSLGTVTVDYQTSDETAIAGVNYVASSGAVTFLDGQTTATLQIQVLDDFIVNGNFSFHVTLSNPTGGATLDPNNVAAVVVANTDRDMIPPVVSGLIGVQQGRTIDRFVITFNEAMDPTRASMVDNYHIFVTNGGVGFAGQSEVAIASANYDFASNSVILVLAQPQPANRFYRVVVNGSFGNALTDASGNVLTGLSGPASNYDLFYGQGNTLTYTDSQSNEVTIKVTRGGLISMFRGLDGQALNLNILGVNPGKTKLMGTVKKLTRKATGLTTIDTINGFGRFGRVVSNLTTPPFYTVFAPVGIDTLSGPAEVTAASVKTPLVTVGRKTPRSLGWS